MGGGGSGGITPYGWISSKSNRWTAAMPKALLVSVGPILQSTASTSIDLDGAGTYGDVLVDQSTLSDPPEPFGSINISSLFDVQYYDLGDTRTLVTPHQHSSDTIYMAPTQSNDLAVPICVSSPLLITIHKCHNLSLLITNHPTQSKLF